jgi:hypothetical protein
MNAPVTSKAAARCDSSSGGGDLISPSPGSNSKTVAQQNAASAQSEISDVVRAATVIRLKKTPLNILASQLQPGSAQVLGALSNQWSQYLRSKSQKNARFLIGRLVKLGVLEYSDDNRKIVQRTESLVMLGSSKPHEVSPPSPIINNHRDVFQDSANARPCVESSTTPSSISEELYGAILKKWRDVDPTSKTSNREFDSSGGDPILLAYHVALGMKASEVRKLWKPEVSAKNFARYLYQATGFYRSQPFRAQFLAELKKSLLQDVRRLVCEKVRLFANSSSELSDDETERLSNDVYLCCANNKNGGTILSRLFQLNPNGTQYFANQVLLSSKDEFLKILRASPLSKIWDDKTIPLIERRSQGAALRECSNSYQISKERVSQLVDQAETIHPLIRSIIRAKVTASGKLVRTNDSAPELRRLIGELS